MPIQSQCFFHGKKNNIKLCWFCDDVVPGFLGICNDCALFRGFKFIPYKK